MNKYQKIAIKMARNDVTRDMYKNCNVIKIARAYYAGWNGNRESWNIMKCLDYKNWSKCMDW